MTEHVFTKALAAGARQVAIWSQLLDRINVFPVADGDTGRNLVISLAPLQQQFKNTEELSRSLLVAARGNSGNIASRFLQELATAASFDELPVAVQRGRDQAYEAVRDPQPGTMLSLFDELADLCAETLPQPDRFWTSDALSTLEQAVAATPLGLPVLGRAGVVDAGALGMYLFFDGFFTCLAGTDPVFSSETALFSDRLSIDAQFHPEAISGYCIDAVLESGADVEAALDPEADSAVVMRSGDYVKVHLHAPDLLQARAALSEQGKIISWADDDLAAQTTAFSRTGAEGMVHIMTDAAGSLTREDAAELGITLLDSYINIETTSMPETCCEAEALYRAMLQGQRCSTAQASAEERCQRYRAALELHPYVVYLCVGSAYTGNFATATAWKREHDPDNRFTIIDTGAASGRLAVAVHRAARKARLDPAEVEAYVRESLDFCFEYIFADSLKYLAAGGRISKTGAFFGDMLKRKPVISPQPDGARRVAMVRNRAEQMSFALDKLAEVFASDGRGIALLQYTDNRGFVEQAATAVRARFPWAELLVRPLSLTTGVHTGPGTWAVAFAADE